MSQRSQVVASRLCFATLLCALALGIFGMHGLLSVAGSSDHPGHHVSQTTSAGATVEVVGGVVEARKAPPVHHSDALMLCVMILTSGIAAGLWLYAKGRAAWRLPRILTGAIRMAVVLKPLSVSVRQLTVLRI